MIYFNQSLLIYLRSNIIPYICPKQPGALFRCSIVIARKKKTSLASQVSPPVEMGGIIYHDKDHPSVLPPHLQKEENDILFTCDPRDFLDNTPKD